MKTICFICSQYPNKYTPFLQVFTQQLIWSMADKGINCIVIAPKPLNLNPNFIKLSNNYTEETPNNSIVNIYCPKFISFGQKRYFGINFSRITSYLFYKSANKIFKKISNSVDVVYGHFLTPSGVTVAQIGCEYNLPSFVAYGESSPWSIEGYGQDAIIKKLSNLNGIIAVSTFNKKTLVDRGIFPENKIKVFPNGIRGERYFQKDKNKSRELFGFKKDSFIVAYVGYFSDRKGALRLAKAVDGLEGVEVAFAGRGDLIPKFPNCIFKETVDPENISDFLSSADIFVLPTQSEGCSNAIIEAMACGLPIISSNLPFNDDILNSDNSILVDPNNIEDIRKAIVFLKNNPLKISTMKQASLVAAKKLTLESRAESIYSWMNDIIDHN